MPNEENYTSYRPQWRTGIGFLFAAIGSAVGLGNIWRFPYIAYKNGGGAFLIPYLVALVTAGIPILMLEFALGHQKRASAPKAFSLIGRKWEWIGWWSVIFIMFGIMAYYTVVIGWCFNYLCFSFTQSWGSDPNTYFFKDFLHTSSGVWDIQGLNPIILAAVALIWFVNWAITYQGLENGIERAVKFMMPVLFIITAIIVVWSVFLEGAGEGVLLYLTPDFSKITNVDVWVAAYGQIFFSLSLGFGIMIAYASYLPKGANILKSSIIVACTNCFYEMFAGFGVFAVLGYMAFKQNIPIQETVTSGIGLAFVAYPKAISMLPLGTLFGILFFFLLCIAGISSSISIIEAFTAALNDKFSLPRNKMVTWLCIFGFAESILFTTNAGLYWLDIVDHFINHYGLISVGILEAVIVGWLYKTDTLKAHILRQLGESGSRHRTVSRAILQVWVICIRYITPTALGIAIINSLITEFSKPYEGYPVSGIIILGVGWLLVTHIAAIFVSGLPWKRKR
jgi:NSS family neurotransmitter:Na+ symporter